MTVSTISIVGIGGTTRAGSTSERVLLKALDAARQGGAHTRAFRGSDLVQLPIYDPERTDRHPMAAALVEAARTADGIIVASPGYHGSISGMVKNAIDYLEDLRDDDRVYLTGRAWGSIAAGAGWQSVYDVLHQLRAIGVALRAWTAPMGVAAGPKASDGDERVPFQTDQMVKDLVWFARRTTQRQ